MATVRFSPGSAKKGPSVPGGSVSVPPRLVTPAPIPRPTWQKLLIAAVILVVVGMVLLMVSQPAYRTGPLGIMSVFFPVMLMVSMGGMIFGGRMSGGGDKQLTGGQLDKARKDYFKALDETGDSIQDTAAAQFAQAVFYYPEPSLLSGFVGSDRMWERTPAVGVAQQGMVKERSAAELASVHFGCVRMGVGRHQLAIKLVHEDQGDPADYEPASFEAERQFTLAQKSVSGIAKAISLRAFAGIGLVGTGGLEPVYGLVRSMVLQAAVFHSPKYFQVMVLTDDPARWDWLKWLPHNQHPDAARADYGGSARMVWTRLDDLLAAVDIEHGRGAHSSDPVTPHWLVICDQVRPGSNWDPITRAQLGGVAGVTFLRLAAERGEGLEFTARATHFVTESMITDCDGEPFAVPDFLDEPTARVIARKMARYSPEGTVSAAGDDGGSSDSPDLCEMLDIADALNVDLDRLWGMTAIPPRSKGQWSKQWGWFPFAVDEYGKPVAVDFKEPDFGGHGAHMVGIGFTGSGKSEFIKTLLSVMCLTHSPEMLNVAFFDLKGSTTAHTIKDFANVVAAVTDLEGDYLLDRMAEGIKGEVERRKALLDRAHAKDVYQYEEMRIHRGENLEPLPWLFIIVDEFTQWFDTRREEAKELTSWLSRQGRGLGMSLIMLSQTLGHHMARGQDAMANIPIRMTLRVLEENDSRDILGVPDGAHIPMERKGAGYLKVIGAPRVIGFQTAYVSKEYEPPPPVDATENTAAPEFVVGPRLFTAAAMSALPKEALASPQAPPVGEAAKPAEILGPDGRPLQQIQAFQQAVSRKAAALAYRPHQIWCPPLESVPSDVLVGRLRGRPWQEGYGAEDHRRLLFAVGVEDRPRKHAQVVYAPDVTDSNVMVPGESESGRTTALATMIVSAALTYTPRRVQFVVLAFSGADLNDVQHLPHVVSFARGSERQRVSRSIAEIKALIGQREAAFNRDGIKLTDFRAGRFGGGQELLPEDPFGDVFLVIDGWNDFKSSYEPLVADIEEILRRGPRHGAHMIISSDGWIASGLNARMMSTFTANVELKLPKVDETNHNPNPEVLKTIPFGEQEVFDAETADQQLGEVARVRVRVTGRGRSMLGYHFQTGRPWLTIDGERVGVNDPRAAALIGRVAGQSGAEVRLLPERVSRAEVWDKLAPDARRAGVVPFGLSEVDLGAAYADFNRHPHLVVTGAARCGKSSALASVAQGVMDVYGPEEAKVYVISPDNALVQYVGEDYLGRYEALEPTPAGTLEPSGRMLAGYVSHEDQIIALDNYLGRVLAGRVRPDDVTQEEIASGRRRWSGPEVFVLVDNEHELEAWVSGTWGKTFALTNVAGFIKRASEVGLHVIVARRINGWARINTALMSELLEALCPIVVMSGERGEGKIVGDLFAEKMISGRGTYVVPDEPSGPAQFALPDPAGTPSRRQPQSPRESSTVVD
ncbi:type VII secretion protein EccCb [Mycobacterium attenuatum]|uniref:type VII secretion protein EccCb n=1 Tax=Mycobacterium attenuatum TaxID=2341086 RepID=UPI000F01EE62|nr:type VII secretion protein EccCb [Mycobacterium attenuatum]VBA62437.1 ESX-5 secretion system protein EccC5 [Mycobacterium attenuatum]